MAGRAFCGEIHDEVAAQGTPRRVAGGRGLSEFWQQGDCGFRAFAAQGVDFGQVWVVHPVMRGLG